MTLMNLSLGVLSLKKLHVHTTLNFVFFLFFSSSSYYKMKGNRVQHANIDDEECIRIHLGSNLFNE